MGDIHQLSRRKLYRNKGHLDLRDEVGGVLLRGATVALVDVFRHHAGVYKMHQNVASRDARTSHPRPDMTRRHVSLPRGRRRVRDVTYRVKVCRALPGALGGDVITAHLEGLDMQRLSDISQELMLFFQPRQ